MGCWKCSSQQGWRKGPWRVTASVRILQQGQSCVSELPLQHTCRDREQVGSMNSGVRQIPVGIPAHHLLAALLGQCPLSDPQCSSSVKWG